jgi:hypothetical protein
MGSIAINLTDIVTFFSECFLSNSRELYSAKLALSVFRQTSTESPSCLPRLAVRAKRLTDWPHDTEFVARRRSTSVLNLPMLLGAFQVLGLEFKTLHRLGDGR